MGCPYCDSSDWEPHEYAFKFEELPCGIWAYYKAECLECGKTFVAREWYTSRNYDYECMTEEKFKESV